MRCSRCQGLMVTEHLLDMEGGFGEMWVQSWRCSCCGALFDAVIDANRRARAEYVLMGTGEEAITQEDAPYLGGEAFIRPAA
jgi:hypothetical protein